VFFHRRQRYLLVDLKVGRFSYGGAGWMHFYRNYAREHWMKPGENSPVPDVSAGVNRRETTALLPVIDCVDGLVGSWSIGHAPRCRTRKYHDGCGDRDGGK
jgi:hypothetical protein